MFDSNLMSRQTVWLETLFFSLALSSFVPISIKSESKVSLGNETFFTFHFISRLSMRPTNSAESLTKLCPICVDAAEETHQSEKRLLIYRIGKARYK